MSATTEYDQQQESFHPSVLKLLLSVGENQGLKGVHVEKLGQWEKGENYLGEVTPVRIIGENGFIDVIVKSALSNECLRKNVAVELIYHKEVFLYTQVAEIFRKFETTKNISDPLSYVAKCYATTLGNNKETLILENLKSKGFELVERRKPLNHDHIQLVLETYGKWHALSFALRQQNFQQYEKLCEGMKYNPTIDFYDQFDCANILIKDWTLIKNSFNPKTESNYIDFLDKCIRNIGLFPDDLYEIDQQYSVIIHGDGWTNNFLWKYCNEEERKPIKLYLIDFQLSRIGSPVLDLSYFLYCCTGGECLNHLNTYLRIYHNSLSLHLKRLGTNVDDVYTFNRLENEWSRWSKWGFMISFILIKIELTERSEAVNLQETTHPQGVKESFSYTVGNIEEYKLRCKAIVKHVVDNNFINL